jgi:DNA-3-methyladenine glycosylase II
MAGELDHERLRAVPESAAIAQLERIRGIGRWTASHILLRGCGVTDADPIAEPRVLRGFAAAYGLDHTPTEREYTHAARRWRPFGMWVAVLLVRSIANSPAWHGTERRAR